jgi:hypothetical protein
MLAANLLLLPLWLVVLMILYLAICAWYDVFQFTVFAGDDLRSFLAAQQGFTGYNEMTISFYKFRPLTALLFGIVAHVTKSDFRAVASVSMMLHAVNGLLFFYILYRQIRLPLLISIAMTAIAIFNRFCTYLFMQDSALTVGLAIALFLLILITASPFIERPTVGRALCLVILYAAIIHTYEPYLVLGLPLVLLGVCTFRSNRLAACVVAIGAIAAALLNFSIKKFFLGTPLLIGTTTRPITFNVPQILLFAWRGILNLVGINSGPAYLSLEDFPDSPLWMRVVYVTTAVLSIALVLGAVASIMASGRRQKTRSALFRLALYTSAIAGLLLSASITFRQMYMWLYPAYLGFLVLLGFSVQKSETRHRGFQLGLTCLVVLSISREVYLSRRHSVFFAFQADAIANNLFTTLHHVDGVASIDTILIRGEVPSKDWVFMANRFFRGDTQLPAGYTFSKFYALPNLEFDDKGSGAEVTDEARLVLEYDALSRSFEISRKKQLLDVESHQMNYSVLKAAAAAFPPNPRWSTPTKTPVFLMSKNGVNCVIAVAPVDIRVRVPHPGSVLHVCFSHMYAKGDGADLEIASLSPAGTKLLLSRVVPPLLDNDFPVWRKYEFALPADAEQVDLHVFSKTDPVADWIAIRDFSFD